MSRLVQIVLVCEDTQQEAFVRRFLKGMKWPTRRLRIEKAPPSRKSAEQFVRKRYPVELSSYRAKRGQVSQAVLVIVDGDHLGVKARLDALDEACLSQNIKPREDSERVAIFVPTWNIETWLAYLEGEAVSEEKRNYPRLKRERDCQMHVDKLVEMCQSKQLRQPAPPSMHAACDEFNTRIVPTPTSG